MSAWSLIVRLPGSSSTIVSVPRQGDVSCVGAAGRVGFVGVGILDIDGTLVDTNYHHTVAWYRAFRQSGIVLPLWRIHRHIGMGGDQLVASLTDDATDEEKGDDIRAAEKALYLAFIEEV